ncbi:AMP-binding protein [uncultured Williamsia sp.]|uniref:class I adenylate-forming enzyme family protein n=1 Tax=uncultured Williamsia sp. TaxID=259311 RepID=UPI00261A1F0F|nr:AMP-binding protein [uncultured Williamsia sp.]
MLLNDSALLTEAHRPADTSVEILEVTVGQLLVDRAATHADTLALVGTRHGDHAPVRLTYAELLDEALRVATALRTMVEPGAYVAIWAPNVVEWPVIEYGAALAGVVLVALNPVLRAGELDYAIGHSGAQVLLHADRSREYDMSTVAQDLAAHHPGLTRISLSDRERWRSDVVDPRVLVEAPTDPDAVVMLQYTSGTTSTPKGVVLRHRSLVNVARLTLDAVGVERGAVAVNPLPMFHTAACVIGTLGPLWTGGTVVLVEQFDPRTVLGLLRAESASVLFYVPAVLSAIIEAQRGSDAPAPQLAVVMGGASTVTARMIADARELFGASVINLYGMTELSPVVSATRPDDTQDDQVETVGRPLPQVECKIVDPVTGESCACDETGEICARGYQRFVEYLDDPDATAGTIDADGFVHTGDLGAMDARGYLRITGRLKEMIIRGGENIAPAEIETCLARHPSVLSATVVGLPDERLGEVVAAVITVRGDEPVDLREQLVAHVREHLSPHKCPTRWFIGDELPVTPTGKVRKFELVSRLGRGEFGELPDT